MAIDKTTGSKPKAQERTRAEPKPDQTPAAELAAAARALAEAVIPPFIAKDAVQLDRMPQSGLNAAAIVAG